MEKTPTRYETAMGLALEAHSKQVRKTDGTPYVIHPLMCAHILTKHGFSEEVIISALLHDTLEDTEVTEETLLQLFGEEVLRTIQTVSEDKSLEWEDRKYRYVEAVKEGTEGAKAVCIADKIHNMQSLLFAYDQQGSVLWDKFSRGKDKKLWFEELCLTMFRETWEHPLIEEYEKLVARMRTLK